MAGGLYENPHFNSQLLSELNLTQFIPEQSMNRIISYEDEREKEMLKKRSPQYRKQKNEKRRQKRCKKVPSGYYNDNKKEMSFE